MKRPSQQAMQTLEQGAQAMGRGATTGAFILGVLLLAFTAVVESITHLRGEEFHVPVFNVFVGIVLVVPHTISRSAASELLTGLVRKLVGKRDG